MKRHAADCFPLPIIMPSEKLDKIADTNWKKKESYFSFDKQT